jgi:hypothetical protein
MSTLDTIRENGTAYHYRLACGLMWLLERVSDSTAQDLLNSVALLPSMQESHTIAESALSVLDGYRKTIDIVSYSAIFTVFNESLRESQ